jgi:hypothetical protein
MQTGRNVAIPDADHDPVHSRAFMPNLIAYGSQARAPHPGVAWLNITQPSAAFTLYKEIAGYAASQDRPQATSGCRPP